MNFWTRIAGNVNIVRNHDSSAINHLNTHLTTKYNIRNENQRGNPALPAKLSESSKAFFTKKIPFKREVFQFCLIDWILQDRISFHEIESEAFWDMILFLRPEAEETLHCTNTIRAHCMQRFQETREQIKNLFIVAKFRIHISADLWMSPNNYTLLGIVVHWWNVNDTLQAALIALPKLYGAHTGANIGKAILDTLDLYNITEKLGYFMLNNATSNNTAVEAIIKELRHHEVTRTISAKEARLRCSEHIINLVVKSLFFSTNVEALKIESVEFETWQRIGPIGRLHNIIRHIRVSSQRRDWFLEYQANDSDAEFEPIMAQQNNDTWWDSTFDMIDRALQPQVHCAIDKFIDSAIEEFSTESERKDLKADWLKEADWNTLQDIHQILVPFRAMTKELQRNMRDTRMNGAIFDVLPCMDFLLQQLETTKQQRIASPILASSINLA